MDAKYKYKTSLQKKTLLIFWAILVAFGFKKLEKGAKSSKKKSFLKNFKQSFSKMQNLMLGETVEKYAWKFNQKKLSTKKWRKFAVFTFLLMVIKLVGL
jgi:hypothetical protein